MPGQSAIEDSDNLLDQWGEDEKKQVRKMNREELMTEIQEELGIFSESHTYERNTQFTVPGLKAILTELKGGSSE